MDIDVNTLDDRHLLSMAAAACCVRGEYSATKGLLVKAGFPGMYWDPRNSTDDAMWMAARLGLSISFDVHAKAVTVNGGYTAEGKPIYGWCLYTDDPAAAIRRALVMTAASMSVSASKINWLQELWAQ